MACAASTTTIAPCLCALSITAWMGLMVPRLLEAEVIATILVLGLIK